MVIYILANATDLLLLQDNFVNVHGLIPKGGHISWPMPHLLLLQDNFVNVHGLSLNEGQRYYICILANATELKFEKFTQHLDQNSECSNGIVVDRTPPIAGQVWVGSHQKHWHFQVSQWSHSGQDTTHHWSSVGR